MGREDGSTTAEPSSHLRPRDLPCISVFQFLCSPLDIHFFIFFVEQRGLMSDINGLDDHPVWSDAMEYHGIIFLAKT